MLSTKQLKKLIKSIVKKNPNITTIRILPMLKQEIPNEYLSDYEYLSDSYLSYLIWSLIDCGELCFTDDCGIELKKE